MVLAAGQSIAVRPLFIASYESAAASVVTAYELVALLPLFSYSGGALSRAGCSSDFLVRTKNW